MCASQKVGEIPALFRELVIFPVVVVGLENRDGNALGCNLINLDRECVHPFVAQLFAITDAQGDELLCEVMISAHGPAHEWAKVIAFARPVGPDKRSRGKRYLQVGYIRRSSASVASETTAWIKSTARSLAGGCPEVIAQAPLA